MSPTKAGINGDPDETTRRQLLLVCDDALSLTLALCSAFAPCRSDGHDGKGTGDSHLDEYQGWMEEDRAIIHRCSELQRYCDKHVNRRDSIEISRMATRAGCGRVSAVC